MGTRVRPRALVLKADGTNCEVETAYALWLAGAEPRIVPVNLLRWGEEDLRRYDLLALPGGFSYGDDVAAGRVLAVELMHRLGDQLAAFAVTKPVLGICNGFQVLARTGLLPFGNLGRPRVTLASNESNRYECRWVRLARCGQAELLAGLPPVLELPVAHAEGRLYADDATLDELERRGQIAFRYVDENGQPTQSYPANPNGSQRAIAGLTDPSGRILGLMPHPERYVTAHQHPDRHAKPAAEMPDGLALLRRLVELS